jgi:uncharacterized protein
MLGTVQHNLRKPESLMALIGIAAATTQAFGVEPSFDCAKAEGTVEQLICEDAGLAALDRKLAKVYEAALKRVKEDGYEDVRPSQRGWVKGRNDCWKAVDARLCVETGYKRRIAELHIGYGDFVVPSTITYACGDFDLATVFYRETDPPTVVLTPVGRREGADQVIAFLSQSGSGARYEGANASFWEHHGEARLTWFGRELTCKVR